MKYDGARDARGVPHGFGILVTEALYYKGEFQHGKFHGRGFMRRFGPPGSASETSPASNGASPQASSPRHLDATATLESTVASPISSRPMSAGSSTAGSPSPGRVRDRGNRAAVWTYYGEFSTSKRHGFGKILFHRTGEQYEGEWDTDTMKGEGIYTLPATGTYTGSMANSRRHGIGSMLYVDGSGYRGHWFQDVIHGGGRLVEPNGTYFDGHWNRGIMNGTFHVHKPSGSVYRRQYLDGRPVRDEKLKARDLYQRLFEKDPEKLGVEQRLAQVFSRNVPGSPDAAGSPGPVPGGAASSGPAERPGEAGAATLERRDTLNFLRVGDSNRPVSAQTVSRRTPNSLDSHSDGGARPQVGEMQGGGGGRETTFTTGEVTVVDVDDMDFSPPPVNTTTGADGDSDFPETPAHDALVKNKSFVRPLNEIAAELRPTPKNRRPHTADSRERPWSAGTHGTDEDNDDDAVAAGAGSPASPSDDPGARHARRRSTIRGGEELAKYAVSPNATLTGLSPNATINASALDGVASLTSPASRVQPHESSLSPGPLSPDSQTLVDRLASALRQDAERLGDAPLPPALAAAAAADDDDDDDEHLSVEEVQRRKREAELDRRASIAITRAHSIMSPKTKGVSAPTPRSGGRPPLSPRGGPAGEGVTNSSMAGPPASNMSFAGRPPPMDLGPAGDAGSFAQPPALSNESIVWGASTVGSAGGLTAQSAVEATPRQLPATTSNFSFASASFALSPQQNSRRPPTESTQASDSPNALRPAKASPSQERAAARGADGPTGIAPPRALKPASVPRDDEGGAPVVSTFSFAGTMMSMSSDGVCSDGDDETDAPKLPDAPPPAALFETVKRMNDSTGGGVASTCSPTSPAGASLSQEDSLPRSKSVRFSAEVPKSRAEAPTTAPSPSLPVRRTASSMMSPKGSSAATDAETPKYGRRSSMAAVKADR